MPRIVETALSSVGYDWPARADITQDREAVFSAIKRLPERLATVVMLRFYGEPGENLTLAEIGKRLGVSDERVRQLLKKAILRLRTLIQRE